jgi:hypothetical protein
MKFEIILDFMLGVVCFIAAGFLGLLVAAVVSFLLHYILDSKYE